MEATSSAATHLAALLSTLPVAGTITDNIIIWVPLVFFGIIIYFLWRMMRLMPRVKPQVMQTDSDSAVTWDDVAGVPEARSELEEVVDFLSEPDRFADLGARVPKGILLYGPPGTGKTLLAKAVARESGAAFYGQSASAFVEMFAGLGASRIRKLFDTARKNQPAIVFIDELDAVGMKRSGNSFNREHDQTLNQLLVELDGFQGAPQVVVIAASNRLEDLDPALLRPGRFDRQVLVMPPDLSGRISILNVHTRGKPLGADIDLEQIARQTSGLTGADLANLCNEAAISAGRANRGSLIASDFDLALERVVAGPTAGAESDDRLSWSRPWLHPQYASGRPLPPDERGTVRPPQGAIGRACRGAGRVRTNHQRCRE